MPRASAPILLILATLACNFPTTQVVVATIPVAESPEAVAILPDGSKAFVTMQDYPVVHVLAGFPRPPFALSSDRLDPAVCRHPASRPIRSPRDRQGG